MREDEFAAAVQMGRDNKETAELIRRHCSHARVVMPSGNSEVGEAYGLPMGSLELRCEHAPPPRTSGHVLAELAVDFYRANCVGCPHRDPSRLLPTLATLVADRDREEKARQEAAERAARERARRHEIRRERRRALVAGEGYVIRDLAESLDRLDGPDPRRGKRSEQEELAARQVVESARHAPDLFSPPLVESMLEMAVDTAEPVVFTALTELSRAGKCPPRAAVEAALKVLPAHALPEAGRTLSVFGGNLLPADLPPVLDTLAGMAAGRDAPWQKIPSAPEGLLAAAAVDLPGVTSHVIAGLARDDEWQRADAAEAARLLLAADPARVFALGPALAASVRGKDQAYAGTPHPAAAACRALAEAWRGEPDMTVQVIESAARSLTDGARAELIRVVGFLRRRREPLRMSDAAAPTAAAFCVRRVGGDWGEEAADIAARQLRDLARAIPQHLLPHTDTLLGRLLDLCAIPVASVLQAATVPGVPAALSGLERLNRQVLSDARRQALAHVIGKLARLDPGSVLTKVLAVFDATTGDDSRDRTVRVTLLKALEEAVTTALLRDLIPVLYTALLAGDQAVRAAAIRFWAACADAASRNLPDELAELAEPLLRDTYVVVHRTMLDRLPRLGLPARLAPVLLPAVAGWARTYAEDPSVLDNALTSLLTLADMLDDQQQTAAWYGVALAMSDGLFAHDRERMLDSWWPAPLRDVAWTRAALGTMASPDLADYFNQRHEPLLSALLDQPAMLAGVPFEDVAAISDLHAPQFTWRALEPVELLQSAVRWDDARAITERVAATLPPGKEGASGRALTRFAGAAARLEEEFTQTPTVAGDVIALAAEVVEAADALATEWHLEDGDPGGDRSGRDLIEIGKARADAVIALLAPLTADPARIADDLDQAAHVLEHAAGTMHASAAQRRRAAESWKIAAMLCRYDHAVRTADPDGARFLLSAQQQARVLAARIEAEPQIPVPPSLTRFCARVRDLTAADATAADVNKILAPAGVPLRLIDLPDWPAFRPSAREETLAEEPLIAVCVASAVGAPITDTLVVRPGEAYSLEMTVRVREWPAWADQCHVQPVTTLGRAALSLPQFTFTASDSIPDDAGVVLTGAQPLHCAVEQPVHSPAIDCPLIVTFTGPGREETIEVAGYRRLQLRPFDPSKDHLTEHEQTDARLLRMYEALAAPDYDTEDARALCRLFTACVRAGQSIMFDKVFRRGTRVTEATFHDELEKRLRADPELAGRLTRRDPVAGGFDDLLHDDVIAELKVARDKPVTIDDCAKYLGQPTQYGIGRGSQLSVLVVLDHSRKEAPPGVIDNYVGWLIPRLHGLDNPRYPSLVAVLIINTNLPVPSTWSRKAISTQPAT
jgi:hypothetical protein